MEHTATTEDQPKISGLLYTDGFIVESALAATYEYLKDHLQWAQGTVQVFGNKYPEPRLTCFYGEAGLHYKYSGKMNVAKGWDPVLQRIRDQVELVLKNMDVNAVPNVVLGNYYRNGKDKIGKHSDDERGLCGPICSVSLGTTRTFRVVDKTTKKRTDITMKPGSLIIMFSEFQQKYTHEVPKCSTDEGRINLTFRCVTEDSPLRPPILAGC